MHIFRSVRRRPFSLFVLLATLVALASLSIGYRQGLADPVVRHLGWHTNWPPHAAPVRLVLLSDLHVVAPDRPPERLARLVVQVNRLKPDCVLIAGDLVSDRVLSTRHIPFEEALAPLAKLRPRVASYAVLGNHDYWRNGADAVAALERHGVRVLRNQAARCGAVTVGGVDDPHTRHDNVAMTEAAVAAMGGVPVLFAHSPDIFPAVRHIPLTLAGHTHCGQISLPFIGPPSIPSNYGQRYACGLVRENGRTLLVTAGIGTSIMPVRWNVPPDLWIVDMGR